MITRDLVSVIVPAYNHEAYVRDCLESIYAQTYPTIELIILNDGSTDNTDMEIRRFLEEHSHNRFAQTIYINRQHKGVVPTLNELVTISKGMYVFQIASDDVAKPHAIATLYDFLSRHKDYVLAVGDNEIIDHAGSRIYWDDARQSVYDSIQAKYHTFGDFLRTKRQGIVDFNTDEFGSYRSLLLGNYIPNGKMFLRDALIKAGPYKDGILEDWYMNIQLSRIGYIKYLDEVLFSYRWHSLNTIKNTSYLEPIQKSTRKYIYKKVLISSVSLKLNPIYFITMWAKLKYNAIRETAAKAV